LHLSGHNQAEQSHRADHQSQRGGGKSKLGGSGSNALPSFDRDAASWPGIATIAWADAEALTHTKFGSYPHRNGFGSPSERR
jgi:hypothetical protein